MGHDLLTKVLGLSLSQTLSLSLCLPRPCLCNLLVQVQDQGHGYGQGLCFRFCLVVHVLSLRLRFRKFWFSVPRCLPDLSGLASLRRCVDLLLCVVALFCNFAVAVFAFLLCCQCFRIASLCTVAAPLLPCSTSLLGAVTTNVLPHGTSTATSAIPS